MAVAGIYWTGPTAFFNQRKSTYVLIALGLLLWYGSLILMTFRNSSKQAWFRSRGILHDTFVVKGQRMGQVVKVNEVTRLDEMEYPLEPGTEQGLGDRTIFVSPLAVEKLLSLGVTIENGIPLVVWTAYFNELNAGRRAAKDALEKHLASCPEITHIHLTHNNVRDFILPDSSPPSIVVDSMPDGLDYVPKGLSMNHLADYMRIYVLAHFGGEWADLKYPNPDDLPDPLAKLKRLAHYENLYVSAPPGNEYETGLSLYQSLEPLVTAVGENPAHVASSIAFRQTSKCEEHCGYINMPCSCCEKMKRHVLLMLNFGNFAMRPGTPFARLLLHVVDEFIKAREDRYRTHPSPKAACCHHYTKADAEIIKGGYPQLWEDIGLLAFEMAIYKYIAIGEAYRIDNEWPAYYKQWLRSIAGSPHIVPKSEHRYD